MQVVAAVQMFGRNTLKQQYICGRLGTYVNQTVISLVIVYFELKERLSADKRSILSL